MGSIGEIKNSLIFTSNIIFPKKTTSPTNARKGICGGQDLFQF